MRLEFLLSHDLAPVRQVELGLFASQQVPILHGQRRARDDERFPLAFAVRSGARAVSPCLSSRERVGVDPLQCGVQLVLDRAVLRFVF